MTDRILKDLLSILKESKDTETVQESENMLKETLVENNCIRQPDGDWRVPRDVRIELASNAISLGAEIESVVELMSWKDFEVFVADILRSNDFRCIESFRRRGNATEKGMEIDVVGVRGKDIVSIDTKMWSIRSGKTSALKTAANKQKDRTLRLSSQLQQISSRIGNMVPGIYSLSPIMVTWFIEEVQFHEGVPIVPIFKLNSFIINLNKYEDVIISFQGRL